MCVREIAYEAVTRSAPALLQLAAPFNDKLKRGLQGRRDALQVLQRWSVVRTRAPLVWLHAPSVGEALMAQAIARALRELRPDVQIAFTHFSPSAERMRERVHADVSGYLPWDTVTSMDSALQALQPAAIAFVRSEIWPTLTRLAAARGIPVTLVNAVLAPQSSRLSPLARYALGPAYQMLKAVGAIDAAAAQRFARLGVARHDVRVTGDARFDQVWQRVSALDHQNALLRRLHDETVTVIVAGSTWPSDEQRLIPAVRALSGVRLLLAPHEPTNQHLSAVETLLRKNGLSCARLAPVETGTGPLPAVILVDRVGVLADLYALADIAYIGGAFQRSGVHSVVEPAALGVPVIFGPGHQNAAEAQALIDAGGALSVAANDDLSDRVWQLAGDAQFREAMGRNARQYITTRLGGARSNAELIEQLLPARPD